MKLNGRRESSNVDDRRGMSGIQKAGIGGLGGIIVAVIMMFLSGGDLGSLISSVDLGSLTSGMQESTTEQREFTPEEQELEAEQRGEEPLEVETETETVADDLSMDLPEETDKEEPEEP